MEKVALNQKRAISRKKRKVKTKPLYQQNQLNQSRGYTSYTNHSNYQPYYSTSSNQTSTVVSHYTSPNNQIQVVQTRLSIPNNQPSSLRTNYPLNNQSNNLRTPENSETSNGTSSGIIYQIVAPAHPKSTSGSCSTHSHGTFISSLV